MTTAFVLSGGGSLGAVQVGMLAALHEQHIEPDFLVGTSVGALNAAYIAAEGFRASSIEALGDIWRNLHRSSVFPLSPLRQALALVGRKPSLCSSGPLRRLVATHLRIGRLEDAKLPVHVIATDVLSGEELVLSTGDALSAIIASASIPAVFRPVAREGHLLVDGGVADNTAVSQAVALGADRIVIVPTGFACALDRAPATPLAAATHALTLMLEQRLIVEVAQFAGRVEIVVAPPLCPLEVTANDFSHADDLISRAHTATRAWLEADTRPVAHPENLLSLHHHAMPTGHGPVSRGAGAVPRQWRSGSTGAADEARRSTTSRQPPRVSRP